MSKVERVLQKIFGDIAASGEFGVIGSKASGSPVTTKDLETIQQDPKYLEGLFSITSDQGTSRLPYTEDINSLFYLITSQLKYIYQDGVPEWIVSEDYYSNESVVKLGGVIYISTFGTEITPNVGNSPEINGDKWLPIANYSFVISDLRLLKGTTNTQKVILSGHSVVGDADMPTYYWSPTSLLDDNNGSVIKPTSVGTLDPGRWIWSNSISEINAKCFGVKGDGVTDDSAAIQAAIDWVRLESNGVLGGVVVLPTESNEVYKIDNSITVQVGVTLKTNMENTDLYDSTIVSKLSGKILLNPAASISVGTNACLKGLCILPVGMTFPQLTADVALWSGTAIIISGNSTRLEALTVVGFEYGVKWTTSEFPGGGRHRWNNILIDCLNGVSQGRNLDVCYFDNIHGWPIATSGATLSVPTDILRPGTFWEVTSISDFQYWTNCFCFGYETGGWSFDAQTSGSMTSCGIDSYGEGLGLGPYTPFSKGINMPSASVKIIGCSIAQQEFGVFVNTTSKNTPEAVISGNSFFNNENSVYVLTGSAIVSGNRFLTGDNGVVVGGSLEADNVLISDNVFSGQTLTGIDNQNNGVKNVIKISDNIYHDIAGKPVNSALFKSIPSDSILPLSTSMDTMTVTGTVGINTFSPLGEWPGREITLLFAGILTVVHSSSIVLKGATNVVTASGNIIKFVCTSDGVWREVSRNF